MTLKDTPGPVSRVINYCLQSNPGGKHSSSFDHSPLLLGTGGGDVEMKESGQASPEAELLFDQNYRRAAVSRWK